MSNEAQLPSGGLGDTIEWKLIDALRQSSYRLPIYRELLVQLNTSGVRCCRKIKLWAAVCELNCQIRITFTIEKFDLLAYMESELEDNDSQSKSELYWGSESYQDVVDPDQGDAISQSRVELHNMVTPKNHVGVQSHESFSPNNTALSHLRDLCSLLEARVNPCLSQLEAGSSGRAPGYPRLARLIRHIQSSKVPTERWEFIPVPGCGPTSFLFNITEDAALGKAFATLADPTRRGPSPGTVERMMEEIYTMKDCFINLSSFIKSLETSTGTLPSLAAPPSRSSTFNGPFASFALLQKFQQKTAAACRAISSEFGLCAHHNSMQHKALLQLPSWNDVSDCHSTEAPRNLPVQLFFTMCPHSNWQPASMYFLQSNHDHAYKKRKLCKALHVAYNYDSDLEFYIPENSESTTHGETLIHIPTEPVRVRNYGESFPDDSASLWTLIEQGYFAKEPSMDLLLETCLESDVLEVEQRKALAIKLVLGTMLSMGSDHILSTWDPKRIHFLKPLDTELTPFISVYDNTNSPGCLNGLSPPTLGFSGDFGDDDDDDDDDPKPLPLFALLAKALLHIARGEHFNSLEISHASERSFRDMCKRFRRVVEQSIKNVTCGKEIDRGTLPFLHAAYKCLDFHTRYQQRVKSAPSTHKMEIAWQLVFDDILAQIDSSLTSKNSIQHGKDVPIAEHEVVGENTIITAVSSTWKPSAAAVLATTIAAELPSQNIGTISVQPEAALFDGEDAADGSTETRRADAFFCLLSNFHDSYSRFVTNRDSRPEGESPRRIRVAVLDTGIDFRHQGLRQARRSGRIKEEWCHSWVGAGAEGEDNELHGTNCVYLLHKAAPEANIFVEKIFKGNSFKNYEAGNIAKAINHAVKQWDIDIVSMSFGLRCPGPQTDGNQAEERAVLKAYENIVDDIEAAIRGVSVLSPRLMFAAASNNGKNEERAFPARCPGVICVHASDGYGNDGGINPPVESGANFMTLGMGHELIRREWTFGKGRLEPLYKTMYKSGSSFATPIAAGVAATILDLAARVGAIGDRAKEKLKRHDGMEKMFELMSQKQLHDDGYYCFLAPWNHWGRHWQTDETRCRLVWDRINDLYRP